MTRYMKKPIPVDAHQYDGTWPPVIAWLEALSGLPKGALLVPIGGVPPITRDPVTGWLAIDTLEGRMVAKPGAWVVRGVRGEFWAVQEDIFAETYEPVDG